MATRNNNAFDRLLAEARQRLEEIKGIMYFGGDALNLGQFKQTFAAPAPPTGTKSYGWLITMTPLLEDYTMPLDTQVRPGEPGSWSTGNIERVPTDDGTFQWLVYTTNYSGDFPPILTEVTIVYSGRAEFTVQQLA